MFKQPSLCERRCSCKFTTHDTKLIVVTGGPGAGKTAILEMARKHFCQHTAIMPEAASIVFGGGFWRLKENSAMMAAQRAIFYVQREMESLLLAEKKWAVGLCDRGTLDGLAYWPESEELFWSQVGSKKAVEMAHYSSVIHLRTPGAGSYNHKNVLRIETAEEAHLIDEKIEGIWSGHPHYFQIPSSRSFIEKAQIALEHIQDATPLCCHVNGKKMA